MQTYPRGELPVKKALYSIALISFSYAVLSASENVALGYELSIYESTPINYWVGISACLIIGVVLCFVHTEAFNYYLPLLILPMSSIYGLPILREYYYWGNGDALTHLGRLNHLVREGTNLNELIYPNVYSLSSLLTELINTNAKISLLILSPIFVVGWIITIAIIVRKVTQLKAGLVVGAISAGMMLPVTPTSHLVPHIASLTAYLFPLLFYLCLDSDQKQKQYQILAMIVSCSIVFYHPITGLAMSIFMIGYYLVQSISNRPPQNAVFSSIIVIVILFIVNLFYSYIFYGVVNVFILDLLNSKISILSFTSQTSSSASSVGTSIIDIAVREFAVAAVYAAICTCGVLVYTKKYIRNKENKMADFTLSVGSGVTTLCLFVVAMSVAGVEFDFLFRNVSIILMAGTILGAALISIEMDRLSQNKNATVALILVSLLILSLFTALPTTASYQPSRHVTEQTYTGYEFVFDVGIDNTNVLAVRAMPYRYKYAIDGVGVDAPRFTSQRVGDHFNNRSLSKDCSESYLTLGAGDKIRETELYNSFRFTKSDFEYLEQSDKINKLVTNGGFKLYKYC